MESKTRTYGNWLRMDGLLKETDSAVIEEVKEMMLEQAAEELAGIGVNLNDGEVEWIIRQNYNDEFGLFWSDTPFEGSKPYITVAWKARVVV